MPRRQTRMRGAAERWFYKSLVALAIPIALQNIINSSLSLFDTFMVGALGEQELAALTLANSVFFVMMLFVFGIQSGCSVLIGQYWGKKDTDAINRIVGMGFYCAGTVTIVAALLVALFPRQIFSITSDNAELVAIAAEYARIVAVSYVFNGFSLVYLGAQRSMENPRIGTIVLALSMALNTVLNYGLIFGNFGLPRMGVAGAALATVLARVVEFCVTFGYALFWSPFKLRLRLLLRPGLVLVSDFVRYSGPVVANETLWGLGFSIFPIIIGHMQGSASGVAAYTIAISIERLMSALYFGVGNAAAIIIGNAIGRGGERDEIYKLGKRLIKITGLFGLAAAVVMAVMVEAVVAPLVFPLFSASQETIALAKTMLYITIIAITFKAINFTVIVGVLRGGGDVVAAALIDIVSMYALALPLAAVAAFLLEWGVLVVYGVMCLEECWKCVASLSRFGSKKWIRNVTREQSDIGEMAAP